MLSNQARIRIIPQLRTIDCLVLRAAHASCIGAKSVRLMQAITLAVPYSAFLKVRSSPVYARTYTYIHTRTHGLIYTRIINPQCINVNSKFKISLIFPHFSLQKVSFYACRMPVVCTEVNICRFSYILQICIFMQLYAIFMHLKHVLCAF